MGRAVSMAVQTEPASVTLCLRTTGPHAEPRAKRRARPLAPVLLEPDPQAADPNNGPFKQMRAYAQYMTALIERHGATAAGRDDYGRTARLLLELRGRIAADNLGLVYALCKRNRMGSVDGDDLLSEGLAALLRAIDTFNPWSGYRFSTYACSSIIHAFYRCAKREAERRRRAPFHFDNTFEDGRWCEARHDEELHHYRERLRAILAAGTARLTPIEHDVIVQRFPQDPEVAPLTLCQVGRQMQLSKERVRQLQNSALAKLRAALEQDPGLHGERAALHGQSCAG